MTGAPLIEVEDLRIDLDDGARRVAAAEAFHSASIVARLLAWSANPAAARASRRSP